MRDPLRGLDPVEHLRDPSLKQRYVTTLFDTIAGRYDDFARWFSFGMDAGWKRDLVHQAAHVTPSGGVVLDLACGTGDLLHGLAGARFDAGATVDPPARFVGLDASWEMIRRAGDRARTHRTASWLACGDMTALPFPSASADVVTVGYGMRNVPVLADALREVARVVKPGGWLFTLDFFLPPNRLWRRAFLSYLAAMGALYGYVLHRNAETYRYIARSLVPWMAAGGYARVLRGAGFDVEVTHMKLGGGIGLHGARRRSARA